MVWKYFVAAIGLTLAAIPASADPRTLDVPATAGWKHVRTGVILMPQLGGQMRRRIADYGADEFDIIVSYDDPANGTYSTIYLFHPGVASVPIWFDRVKVAAVSRKENGLPDAAVAPSAFPARGTGVSDGLRFAVGLHDGANKSTAVAVAPVEDWLVVVRMSSPALDAAALDARMTTFLADIRLPAPRTTPILAAPVQPCAAPLKLRRARLIAPDMMQALVGSALMAAVAKGTAEKPEEIKHPVYCRDSEDKAGMWGLYRPDGGTDSYILALADAGRALLLAPSLAGEISGKKDHRYSVILADLDRSLVFPDVDRLPPPEQAIAIINSTAPISSTTNNGQTINLSVDTKAK